MCSHFFPSFSSAFRFFPQKIQKNGCKKRKKDGDKSLFFLKCSHVKLYKESKVKFLMRCIKSAPLSAPVSFSKPTNENSVCVGRVDGFSDWMKEVTVKKKKKR